VTESSDSLPDDAELSSILLNEKHTELLINKYKYKYISFSRIKGMFIGLLGMQTNKKKANYIEVYFYSFNLSCFQVSALLVTKMDKNYRLSI
jgi:hypothetical protein